MQAELIEVTREQAFEAFPNFAVYYRLPQDDNLYIRCWWEQIGGRFHAFPYEEGIRYYLKTKVR